MPAAKSTTNIGGWLAAAASQLESASVPTARLDALVLLEDTIGRDRSWLMAHPELGLQPQLLETLAAQLGRRAKHEPLAYIRGKAEFYGREFAVDQHVLVPRPESETMIELLKVLSQKNGIFRSLADLGTGSGALAITAKLELTTLDVYACDIDPKCLEVAKQNVAKHDVALNLCKGDLIEAFDVTDLKFDVLLCNLPYVPDSHTINPAAMLEPKLAIFGGKDGLDLYRRLFSQLAAKDWRPKFVLTESLPFQHETLALVASKAGFQLRQTDDFIQVFEPNSNSGIRNGRQSRTNS